MRELIPGTSSGVATKQRLPVFVNSSKFSSWVSVITATFVIDRSLIRHRHERSTYTAYSIKETANYTTTHSKVSWFTTSWSFTKKQNLCTRKGGKVTLSKAKCKALSQLCAFAEAETGGGLLDDQTCAQEKKEKLHWVKPSVRHFHSYAPLLRLKQAVGRWTVKLDRQNNRLLH